MERENSRATFIFRETMKRHVSAYSNPNEPNDKEFFRAYGMELLGPPLSVG